MGLLRPSLLLVLDPDLEALMGARRDGRTRHTLGTRKGNVGWEQGCHIVPRCLHPCLSGANEGLHGSQDEETTRNGLHWITEGASCRRT